MVSSKQAYGLTTPFVNVFPDPITKTRSPLPRDKNYPNGFVWIYKNGDRRTSYTFGGLDSNGDGIWIITHINANDITDLTITQSPLLQSNDTLGSAPTGATGDINLMALQDGSIMEQGIIGPGQTIIAPRMTENGLSIGLDSSQLSGAEYNFGTRNNAKHVYTIGTSLPFFIESKAYVEDVSGFRYFLVGFRKVQANDSGADPDDYTDYAAIGLRSVSSMTNLITMDKLNDGTINYTDTTDPWGGDQTAQTIKTLVSASGVVTFEIGGSPVTVSPSFTFDDTDLVMPFIYCIHGNQVTDEISLQTLKIGFQ